MINPAQYTQVLQQASDPQLMAMLKRPDKIPSQFVVAEINRRQSMRQAAMADRQRQAGVQEMMTAQQAAPQQPQQQPMAMREGGMVANAQQLSEISNQLSSLVGGDSSSGGISNLLSSNGNNMNYAVAQPAYQRVPFAAQLFGGFGPRPNNFASRPSLLRGMNLGGGGPDFFTNAGLNTNSPLPKAFGVAPFDPTRETYEQYLDRIGNAKRVANELLRDSAMTNIDQGPPTETPAPNQAGPQSLSPAEMAEIDRQKRLDKRLDASTDTVSSRSFEDIADSQFRDRQDLPTGREFPGPPKARPDPMADNPAGIGERGPVTRPVAPGVPSRTQAEYEASLTDPRDIRGILSPMYAKERARKEAEFQASVDAADRDEQAQQAASLGIRNPVVTPNSAKSVQTGGGVKDFPTPDSKITSAAGDASTAQSTEDMDKTKTASEAASSALSAFSVDIQDITQKGVKSSEASNAAAAPSQNQTSGGASSPPGGITSVANRTIDTTRVDTGPDKTGPTQTSLAQQMVADNAARYATLKGGYENLAEADRNRAKSLQTELDTVTTAMERMAEVYDKNAMKPENRIFRSMIDAGLALAGSKESNFLQAVAESGKAGLQTFDRLNTEEKERLFKKYGAAVDLARTRADITGKINTLMAGADRTALEGEAKAIEGAIAGSTAVMEASQRDTATAQAERGAEQKDVEISADISTREQQLEQTDEQIAQAGERIDISRQELTMNQDLGQQRIDVQREGNDIQLFLGGKRLELSALTAAADDANAKEQNAIRRYIAEKPAAQVAYLNEIVDMFGEDTGKAYLLGASGVTKDRIPYAAITSSAGKMAEADFNNQTALTNSSGQVIPPKNGTEYSLDEYNTYHINKMMGLFGGSVQAPTSGGQGSTFTYTAQGGLQSNNP